MFRKLVVLVSLIIVLGIFCGLCVGMDASYFRLNSGQDWDKAARVAEHADIVVRPDSGGELTEASCFPWWNHWPVSQVASDGRWSYEPDRTSHSSFDNFKWRPTYETELTATRLLLQGMTNKDILTLLPLAKAWKNPPAIQISSDGFNGGEFVRGERAYHITRSPNANELKFSMAGSDDSPVVNPCFVIKGWDAKKLALRIDGQKISRGPDFRWSVEKDAKGVCSLIVWLKKTAMKKVEFLMSPKN